MAQKIDRDGFLVRFKERREALGLSERKACLSAGLSSAAIKNLREREDQLPSMKTINALAHALATTGQWLAFGVDGDDLPGSEPLPDTVNATAIIEPGHRWVLLPEQLANVVELVRDASPEAQSQVLGYTQGVIAAHLGSTKVPRKDPGPDR